MIVEYNDDTHTYTIDGERVWSVTQILERAGVINRAFYKPEHAERGVYVHGYAARAFTNKLSGDDIFPEHDGFCHAVNRATIDLREQYLPEKTIAEALVADKDGRYAGRCDLILETPDGESIIIEIKTGHAQPWAKLQAAAYAKAARAGRAAVLEVREDGTYRFMYVDVCKEFTEFERLMDIANGVGKYTDASPQASAEVENMYGQLMDLDDKRAKVLQELEDDVEKLKLELRSAQEALALAAKPYLDQEAQLRKQMQRLLEANPDARTRSCYTQTRYQPKVVDATQLPREFMCPDMKAIRSAVGKIGVFNPVPGVELLPKVSLVIRAPTKQ